MLMNNDEILSGVREFAYAFAEQRLRPYIERISKPRAIGTAPKEINDAIWGTIKVSPLEVVVLDCPLVQRLRLVRQLGVVHWVYPGATHSRFEHTLGVLHQAQQLTNAINQASGQGPAAAPIDSHKSALVRLCAILHDIGHGVFSHVSEHAIARRVELKIALQAFAREQQVSKIQLSELIAYHLVSSPAFQDMLAVAFDTLGNIVSHTGGSRDAASLVANKVQRAIVGQHIDEQVPLLHEIITGPFDADKLDYYARDARHAGIPSTLDISRLLQKITTQRVPSNEMPEDILQALREPLDTRDLFGLKWSGKAILDELHLARVLLYAKIYRHKKVAAIESMIDALFEALGRHPDIDILKLIAFSYQFHDDQLLVTDAQGILDSIGVGPGPEGLMPFIDALVQRLRDRDLYVSSLSLMPAYPGDPWGDDKPQTRGLDRLMGVLKNDQQLAALRAAIASELRTIADLLPDAIGDLDPASLEYAVVISAKPALGSGTEIDRALISVGDKFVRGRELEMNQTAWADAYDLGKPQGVLFAPRDCAAAAYIAVERLLRREYGVVLPASALEVSKQNPADVDALKRRLEEAGWYANVPFDIRPIPERLLRQDIKVRVDRIVAKLDGIEEPILESVPRRPEAMYQRIVSWLAQFREDQAIECALAALEAMKVLTREDSFDALRKFAAENPHFEGAAICPLGEAKDSGTVQAYLSRDLERLYPKVYSNIGEASAAGGDKPIILIDDFIGSGSQTLDILGNWFENHELQQEQLGEIRLPFGEAERAYLRSRPVAFVYIAAWEAGLDRVRDAARALNLDATVFGGIRDAELPFAFEGVLAGHDSKAVEEFQERCRKIGKDLLASTERDEEKQENRALGYGNRAMLLSTHFNVPTQTLTCIWLDGKHEDVDWHALVRRRPKT